MLSFQVNLLPRLLETTLYLFSFFTLAVLGLHTDELDS